MRLPKKLTRVPSRISLKGKLRAGLFYLAGKKSMFLSPVEAAEMNKIRAEIREFKNEFRMEAISWKKKYLKLIQKLEETLSAIGKTKKEDPSNTRKLNQLTEKFRKLKGLAARKRKKIQERIDLKAATSADLLSTADEETRKRFFRMRQHKKTGKN